MSRYRNRYYTRRRAAATPVVVREILATRKGHCKACSGTFLPGEPIVKLRLKKAYRGGCTTCGHKLLGVKSYHSRCQPADANAAMGFDPSVNPGSHNGACAPPPKPPTFEDAALAALAALEHALVIKVSRTRGGVTPELEAKFKTFQNIKARVLRPGTPAEGEVATHLALRKIIELVF